MRYLKLTIIVPAITVAVTLIIAVWGMNKGFDITDEATSVLMCREDGPGMYARFALVRKCFWWMERGVVQCRAIRFVLTVLCPPVFGLAVWCVLRRTLRLPQYFGDREWMLVFMLVSCLSIPVDYATGRQSLSYNHMNNAVLLISASLFLFWVTLELRPADGLRHTAGLWVALFSGAVLAFDYQVKFSSVLCLLIGFVLVLPFLRGISVWRRVSAIALVFAGFALGCAVYTALVSGSVAYYAGSLSQLAPDGPQHSMHSPYRLVRQYAWSISEMLKLLSKPFSPVFAGCLAFGALAGNELPQDARLRRGLAFSALCVAAVVFCVQAYRWGFWESGRFGTHAYVVLLLGLLCVFLGACAGRGGGRTLISAVWSPFGGLCLLCAMLPFIGAVGTGSSIVWTFRHHLSGWFVLMVLLTIAVAPRLDMRVPLVGLVLTLAVIVQAQFLHGFVWNPYRQPGRLWARTETVENCAILKGVRVAPAMKRWVDGLRGLVRSVPGFSEGDPIIAAYDMPGLVYAVGGRSPGFPWFYDSQYIQEGNCRKLNRVPDAELQRALFFVNQPIHPVFLAGLAKHGVMFPDAYDKVGEVEMLDITSRAPYTNVTVEVFAPRVGATRRDQ